MSYETWHNYGYGIKVDDIGEVSAEKICSLIHMSPELEKEVQQWFLEAGISEPEVDDYFEALPDDEMGRLGTLLKLVIRETEGIELFCCDDFDDQLYLIYLPSYPWQMVENHAQLTEEFLQRIFAKYTQVLTDEPIEVDFQSVGNGA